MVVLLLSKLTNDVENYPAKISRKGTFAGKLSPIVVELKQSFLLKFLTQKLLCYPPNPKFHDCRWLALTGLFLIGAGTGGIKPCVSSFGGDQFVVPQQEKQLQQFFSVFYFSINAGSVISCFLTPMLRANVSCFGDDKCYPLAFGVPAVLMCLSVGEY